MSDDTKDLILVWFVLAWGIFCYIIIATAWVPGFYIVCAYMLALIWFFAFSWIKDAWREFRKTKEVGKS